MRKQGDSSGAVALWKCTIATGARGRSGLESSGVGWLSPRVELPVLRRAKSLESQGGKPWRP